MKIGDSVLQGNHLDFYTFDVTGTAGEAKSGQMCNKRWWAQFVSVVLVSLFTNFMTSIT